MVGRRAASVLSVLAVSSLVLAACGPLGLWRAETIDGTGGTTGQLDASVGRGASAVVYGVEMHVFYVDEANGDLRHSWQSGPTWRSETLDGGSPVIARGTAAFVFAGQLHVVYHDDTNGDLKHAWWDGSRWSREVIDGIANPALGRTGNDVGQDPSALLYGGAPHVFSYDASAGDLRHGWWNGAAWQAETLDGSGGGFGRLSADVGTGSSAVAFGPQLSVFSRDASNGDLRHAWWNGVAWQAQTLDGAAAGPGGQIAGDVGVDTSATRYQQGPHVFYGDVGNGDLRHAWWNGAAWQAETLDGTGAAPSGRTGNAVGSGTAAVLYDAVPHVTYEDRSAGDLRHAWWTGSAWRFETLDGAAAGPWGQIAGDVGADTAAVLFYFNQLHVFSYDEGGGNLRHNWFDPSGTTPALAVNTGWLTGLSRPWDMGFLPDGTMFFTERTGALRVRLPDGSVRLIGVPNDMRLGSEGGMLGLAVDPQFPLNRYVYTCFTSTAPDVRVVRWTIKPTFDGVTARADIVTGLPISTGRHSGCRPRFGSDGALWIGTGDAATGTTPQDLASGGGKVLRVDRNGNGAAGNPFLGSGNAMTRRVYTYGHRNVQGIAFRPGSGQPYSVEHGTSVDDEVNRLVPGGNAGWNPVPGYNEGVPMTDYGLPNVFGPVWASGDPTIAPSGATFLVGPQWKSWDGALAVAVLKAAQLRVFFLDAGGNVVAETIPAELALGVRLRSAVQGPDGSLYIATDVNGPNGAIWRITPG